MQSLVIFAIFLFGAAAVNSLITDCSDTGTLYTADGSYNLTYTRNDDYVVICATAETDTWVAVGFSADMLMVSK